MCRKAFRVLVFAILSAFITTSAVNASPVVVIDDFESYWGTPAMLTPSGPWSGVALPGTSNVLQLLTAGAAQGAQAMQWDYTNNGGWALPADPTNYDPPSDHASINLDLPAPFDITADTMLHMTLRQPMGGMPTSEYIIEWYGDQWSQTWIPRADWTDPFWWLDPATVPAIVVPHDYTEPIEPDHPWWYPGPSPPKLWEGGDWLEIVIDPSIMWSTWGAPLTTFDALTDIAITAFTLGDPDLSGNSGDPKMDGTDQIWPAGPISGSLQIDNIYWEIPEPTTIALLAVGGLALLRKRH